MTKERKMAVVTVLKKSLDSMRKQRLFPNQ